MAGAFGLGVEAGNPSTASRSGWLCVKRRGAELGSVRTASRQSITRAWLVRNVQLVSGIEPLTLDKQF
jgi:hypothetical protein